MIFPHYVDYMAVSIFLILDKLNGSLNLILEFVIYLSKMNIGKI